MPMTLAFSGEVVHEKLWKSVNICKSYSKEISGTFFWTRCRLLQPSSPDELVRNTSHRYRHMHRTDELVRNTSHRYRHMHRTNFTHSPDELVRNTSHRYRHMHRTNFTHLYNTHPAYAEKLLFLLLLFMDFCRYTNHNRHVFFREFHNH